MLNEQFDEQATQFVRDGSAKDRGLQNRCKMKLYLFSSDRDLLVKVLYETSKASDCFQVRFQKDDRKGIFSGTCVFTNESSLGDSWAQYKDHPELWAVVQNEEFSNDFRSRIRKY